jgi:hypothetical protein
MSYETRIVGGTVEVTSPRTGTVYSYQFPPVPARPHIRCGALNVPESASAWRPSGLSVAGEPGPGATSDQVCEAVGSRRRGLLVVGGCTYDLYAAVRWKVVPTLFWMKAPGRRRAIVWVAFQPVQ